MPYSVGRAILARMAQMGDNEGPASDEVYFHNRTGQTQWSEAVDTVGRVYRWIPATKMVYHYDALAGITEEELFNPTPPPPPPSPVGRFTAEQVSSVLGAPLANVRQHLATIYAALDELGIGDKQTVISCLATIGVEVGSFLPIEEYRNADGSIPNGWWGYGGGPMYHGRGFIQLTHDYNYTHYGNRLGIDLLSNPTLALDPVVAARVMALYFKEHDIPRLANLPNWAGVRVAVNGGMTGWQEFADYVDAFVALG